MQQPLVLAVHFLGSFTWAVLCLRRGFCFRSLETASEWALSSPGLPIALRAKTKHVVSGVSSPASGNGNLSTADESLCFGGCACRLQQLLTLQSTVAPQGFWLGLQDSGGVFKPCIGPACHKLTGNFERP